MSRSGIGAHVWVFFDGPVRAETARALGTGLLREAIALRGRMDLAGYDRLFPSQDVLPARRDRQPHRRAVAGPLAQGRRDSLPRPGDPRAVRRTSGRTCPAVHRLSPREVGRLADRVGPVRVGSAVGGLRDRPRRRSAHGRAQPSMRRPGRGVASTMAQLTPAMLATLKHAASMPNPAFYERQRRRFSTWGVPRFLHSFDETLDGQLVLPRGFSISLRRRRGGGQHPGDRRSAGRPAAADRLRFRRPRCARTRQRPSRSRRPRPRRARRAARARARRSWPAR